MKTLLLHPARNDTIDRLVRLPPLGLACVAGALRAAGHDVRLIDAAAEPAWQSRLLESLSAWRPQVVGISASTAVFPQAVELAATAKAVNRGTITILGGVHATLFPGEVLEERVLDIAVHGEGEHTAVELLSALARTAPLRAVEGIAFRDGSLTQVTPRRAPISNLDDLPMPAYDLLPMGRYSTPFSAAGKASSMVTSRGCPHRCAFCDAFVVHGRKYRAHSPERIVSEIRHLAETFGVRELVFKDSEFTLDRRRVEAFCDLLALNGPRVTWTCSSRVSSVDEPLLKKMAAAGCRVVQFGVESADPAILRTLKKNITLDQARKAFSAAHAAGIETVANLMVGTPGETRESVGRARKLIKQLRPDHLNVQVLVPYAGTELHRTLTRGSLAPPEVARRRRRALLRSFYLRPGPMLRRIVSLDSRCWRQNVTAAAQMIGLAR